MDWEFRQAFCKIWVEGSLAYVTIDGWGIDSWFCEAETEEEFYLQCRNYLKSDRFKEQRDALRNKNRCHRCNGKGGFQQITSYSPDGEPDISWDLCPECDGSGIRQD